VYDNRAVLAVLLWAALHERSVHWACQRSSWPVQAWRRRLPNQSTMSRRLRDTRVVEDLNRLLVIIQRGWGPVADRLVVDGKPLPVSAFSGDPDAKMGWGAGRHALGYKLHALIDATQRLLAFEVHPMNTAECVVAAGLLGQAHQRRLLPSGATVLGDPSYDSNPLHIVAEHAGVHLIAPRRRPELGLCQNRTHHPGRLASIAATEAAPEAAKALRTERAGIERYFGSLAASGGGLFALPGWVRRLHRVRAWTGAKLVLNAARLTLRRNLAA
jgi:hypothetical protein